MRRRMLASLGGAKLPYDAEVEYLESNGSAYFDLDLILESPRDSFDLKWMALTNSSSSQTPPFGYFTSTSSTIEVCRGWVLSDYGNTASYRATPSRNAIINTIIRCTGSSELRQVIEGNSVVASNDKVVKDVFVAEKSAFLFAVNGRTNGQYRNRIYSLVVKRDGVDICDIAFVRITDENGNTEGAIYDRVRKRLFTKKGSGVFVIGPDK